MPRVYLRTAPIERFLRFIEILESGCWRWTGTINSNGYGTFWDGIRNVPAHRFACAYFNGPIASNLEPDHLCRNRSCVNPDHLEAVTRRENILRGIGTSAINARRTYCVHGHQFDDANTYHTPTGRRQCLICLAIRNRACQGRIRATKQRMDRSRLGDARPNYIWTCGKCGQVIHGKSNTIHLAIGKHIQREFREGTRKIPYSTREDNDSGRKFI